MYGHRYISKAYQKRGNGVDRTPPQNLVILTKSSTFKIGSFRLPTPSFPEAQYGKEEEEFPSSRINLESLLSWPNLVDT